MAGENLTWSVSVYRTLVSTFRTAEIMISGKAEEFSALLILNFIVFKKIFTANL
jgi:hypothetical protein